MAKARQAGQGDVAIAPGVEAASIVELLAEPGRVRARITNGDGATVSLEARVALIAGYAPSVGDRVLVARGRSEAFVIGVLAAASAPVALADGTSARVEGGAIELRDREGRLVVRHEPGVTTIVAPERDLKLAAPHGRVVIEGGTDVAIHAARDLQHLAGRRIELGAGVVETEPQLRLDGQGAELETPRLDVRVRGAHLVAAETSVVARKIATTAEQIVVEVARYELTAGRLVEKTRDTFRDVVDLLQERVGRAKVIVQGAYALQTKRTTMVSTEETSVDGKKILLG